MELYEMSFYETAGLYGLISLAVYGVAWIASRPFVRKSEA